MGRSSRHPNPLTRNDVELLQIKRVDVFGLHHVHLHLVRTALHLVVDWKRIKIGWEIEMRIQRRGWTVVSTQHKIIDLGSGNKCSQSGAEQRILRNRIDRG